MADHRTFGEKVSDAITDFGGSWKFILTSTILMFLWMVFNTLSFFNVIAWDKYPYVLLNLVLSFVAAFQAPFIMMSQNRAEAKQDDAYRQLFYEIKELVQAGNQQALSNRHDLQTLSKEIKMLRDKSP